MAKRNSNGSADCFRIDCFHRRFSIRPLYGLRRLVRIERRNWNGILFCDSIVTIADEVTFSRSNKRTAGFETRCRTLGMGFMGEPLLSVPNEAPEEQIEQFHDDGKDFVFCFTPEGGKAYSAKYEIYRPLETYHGTVHAHTVEDRRIERYLLTLDLSAYVDAGCSVMTPLCEFDNLAAIDGRGGAAEAISRRLTPSKQTTAGSWEWQVDDVVGG